MLSWFAACDGGSGKRGAKATGLRRTSAAHLGHWSQAPTCQKSPLVTQTLARHKPQPLSKCVQCLQLAQARFV